MISTWKASPSFYHMNSKEKKSILFVQNGRLIEVEENNHRFFLSPCAYLCHFSSQIEIECLWRSPFDWKWRVMNLWRRLIRPPSRRWCTAAALHPPLPRRWRNLEEERRDMERDVFYKTLTHFCCIAGNTSKMIQVNRRERISAIIQD